MSNNITDLNGAQKVVARSPRNGFETRFKLDKILPFARVAALDAKRRIIGSTSAVNTRTGKLCKLNYNITDVGYMRYMWGVPSSTIISVPKGTGVGDDWNMDGWVYTPPSLAFFGGVISAIVVGM